MKRWFDLPIRTKLGVIAVVLCAVAVISVAVSYADPYHAKPLYGVIKWAPVLFLFWVAWPDLTQIPRWVYYVCVPLLVLCALRPVFLYLVVPLGLVALFVMPKK